MSMTNAPLAGKHVVVTGAAGFIGSAFVRHAVRDGARVSALVRPESDLWRLQPVMGDVSLTRLTLDALSATSTIAGPIDAVVHCAAAGVDQTFDDLEEMVETNIRGTVAALRFAARAGAARFVMLGTSGEYGPGRLMNEDHACAPTSEYGATRLGATMIARNFGQRRGLDVVVLRPFAVYGPYEAAYRLVPHAVVRGLRGETIRISSGTQTRDYVHADDVADGIARAAILPAARSGVFNLCTGVDTSVRDAAELIARSTTRGSAVDAGAMPTIPGEMWQTSGNPARARTQLGWAPRLDLERGLTETIAWFRETGAALAQYRASG